MRRFAFKSAGLGNPMQATSKEAKGFSEVRGPLRTSEGGLLEPPLRRQVASSEPRTREGVATSLAGICRARAD